MIVGPYQSKLTQYTGLPESTPTFTLDIMEGSPQLIENGLIFTDLLWVCSQFALNFFHFYFNHKFHTQGDIFWKKNCCESTYQNLSSFQNLYQLLSYLENWACWTWFALNFLEMLSEHEIGTFPTFLMVKIWQFLHFTLFWPEAVVWACFTTLRARKSIDQAIQSYFYFWCRSNGLASRGCRLQCT